MKLTDYTQNDWSKIRALAQRVGCSPMFIYLIGRGERTPGPKMAAKIEEATEKLVTRMELLYPAPNPYKQAVK